MLNIAGPASAARKLHTLITNLGDRALSALMPKATANAIVCDYETWCDRDALGSALLRRYCCDYPGGDYRCGNWTVSCSNCC